jgi:hypothetical protein
MRYQHSSGSGRDGSRGEGGCSRPVLDARSPTTPAERLEYIAAMVQELRLMSAQANCQALASLLDMAYREAEQRRRACQ